MESTYSIKAKEVRSWLTKRQLEILRLIAEGLSSKEIANKLKLSTKTVDAHRANIRAKLHAETTAELIQCAILFELIVPKLPPGCERYLSGQLVTSPIKKT